MLVEKPEYENIAVGHILLPKSSLELSTPTYAKYFNDSREDQNVNKSAS